MKYIFFYTLFLFVCMANSYAYDGFAPGVTWNDTNGARISAHGGQVVYSNGAYYWIGENKPGDKSTGVSCYKSTDLYNWQKLPLALSPTGTMGDPETGNDIAQGRNLERPKIMYNDTTDKWVMWIHWENGKHYGEARACVAVSDKVEGPYTFINTFRPNNHPSRDQTIFKDTDGKGYHFANINFNDMNIDLLSDDYLTATETQNNTFVGRKYEAPAIFKVGDTYYGLYSLSDGWKPTPGQSGYATDIMGTWTYGGNFAVDNERETTYRSQSTCVFKVQGYENAYIYMGDRWDTGKDATSYYVWLPLSVRTGYPTVKWYANWNLSVFQNADRYKRAKTMTDENSCLLLEKNSDRWLSQNTNYGLHIADDNEAINLKFNFIETEKPYVYKIREIGSGKYFESVFGALLLNPENDKPGQEWLLLLQDDGYYKIKNTNDNKYFAVNGASTLANSGIYLSDATRAKCFALYFDSKYFDYEAADIYSKDYKEETTALAKAQKEYLESLNPNSIEVLRPDFGPVTILVYAINGQLIYTQTDYTENLFNFADLTEKLNTGVYSVKMVSGNSSTVQKIIVK